MPETNVKLTSLSRIPRGSGSQASLEFAPRESAEIVIGFSGAIGCGMSYAVAAARRILGEFGYGVVHLKLSRFIEGLLQRQLVDNWDAGYENRNRYERLQIAGNSLRNSRSPDFLAELAIAVISTDRITREQRKHKDTREELKNIDSIVPGRVAYLIDQLKHPEEVQLLRKVYGNLFYLVGVLASEKQRTENLRKDLAPIEVGPVIERDRQDNDAHGQQLDKTLRLADFFLRNNRQNDKSIEKPLRRFFSLIHGETSRTPTKDEYAMYAAFSAGLRSACLSRQVGAAITDAHGNMLATGCNDVPKAHGGLYSEDDGDHDHRCVNLQGGICFNDRQKDLLEEEIQAILIAHDLDRSDAGKIAAEIRNGTRLKDLLEFSRSVHAEMDALVSVVRKGGDGVVGGRLFTTTFPCHNCARHIVAAGIARVFYIEPYEKSLALELHSDSIGSDSDDGEELVRFLHFEGVSPRKYQELFHSRADRKTKGEANRTTPAQARKSTAQYLDSYRDLETKVVENLVQQGLTKNQIVELSDPVVIRAQ